MRRMNFAEAIEDVLAGSMAADPRIIIMGEDVRMLRRNLLVRFGEDRILDAPISEAAFLGAGLGAAMAGLRPVVEIMMVDFIGVSIDVLLNHASMLETFSGGSWKAPLVVRTACGAGYGDGGQHGQTLWGWLAHIPGLVVLVPSTPADAGGLMLTALQHEGPVIFMEHKLLSEYWLDFLGRGGRSTVDFDVPEDGANGLVPSEWAPLPLGKAVPRRVGDDLTIVSVGIGVHRGLEAASDLETEGISAGVIDLRSVEPLDRETVCKAVSRTGRMLVVDEDYQGFGLSGELAACVLEAGLSVRYGRVCTAGTIPYSMEEERKTLPNKERIKKAALKLTER